MKSANLLFIIWKALQKYFLNFEKQQGMKNKATIIIINGTEATDQICILDHIKNFYETLKKTRTENYGQNLRFCNCYWCFKIFWRSSKTMWEELIEKDLYKSLKSMQNDKSLGNNGLKKFWNIFGWTDGNLCRFCTRSYRKTTFKYISKTAYH